MKRFRALLIVALAITLSGCEQPKRVGTVTGTLTYEKQPFANATVTFVSADGSSVAATTNDSGQYSAMNVPVGKTMVSVTAQGSTEEIGKAMKVRGQAEGKDHAKALADEAKAIAAAKKLPERYSDPVESKLSLEVVEGNNTLDLPLTK